jgi:hypothetical protein
MFARISFGTSSGPPADQFDLNVAVDIAVPVEKDQVSFNQPGIGI